MGRVGKDFEKLTVCAEIVPVGGLGVLTSGAIFWPVLVLVEVLAPGNKSNTTSWPASNEARMR